MSDIKKITKEPRFKDKKVMFQTLWIFAMLNYLCADIVTLMDSSVLKEKITGTAPALYYIFFAAIEIPCTILIVVLTVRWKNNESSSI